MRLVVLKAPMRRLVIAAALSLFVPGCSAMVDFLGGVVDSIIDPYPKNTKTRQGQVDAWSLNLKRRGILAWERPAQFEATLPAREFPHLHMTVTSSGCNR